MPIGDDSLVDRLRSVLVEQGYLVLDGHERLTPLLDSLGPSGPPERLHAADSRAARVWSLSGTFGRNSFPWHTDGAISSRPPRWLVLQPVCLSSPTTTDLLDLPSNLRRRLRRTVLLAKDRAGRSRYLPGSIPTPDGERVRWDPRTCIPCTPVIGDDIASTAPTATVEWRIGRTLILDNHRLLHRRPAVARGEDRVLERTYIWSR